VLNGQVAIDHIQDAVPVLFSLINHCCFNLSRI